MASPEVQFNIVDNVWCKQMQFVNVGDVMEGHTHNHHHLTLLAYGSLEVTVEGEVTVFNAPHMIFIHKDKEHTLKALVANTIAYCIHGLRDKDTGDMIDPEIIPRGVANIYEYAEPIAPPNP